MDNKEKHEVITPSILAYELKLESKSIKTTWVPKNYYMALLYYWFRKIFRMKQRFSHPVWTHKNPNNPTGSCVLVKSTWRKRSKSEEDRERKHNYE